MFSNLPIVQLVLVAIVLAVVGGFVWWRRARKNRVSTRTINTRIVTADGDITKHELPIEDGYVYHEPSGSAWTFHPECLIRLKGTGENCLFLHEYDALPQDISPKSKAARKKYADSEEGKGIYKIPALIKQMGIDSGVQGYFASENQKDNGDKGALMTLAIQTMGITLLVVAILTLI